ncbi:MAG: hypothetical protein GF350_00225, partial [Chitinivibrionales bacterium]|nr:hypothetical protein [Chitinivibrionales bacterium]
MEKSLDQMHEENERLRAKLDEQEKEIAQLKKLNEKYVDESRLFHALMDNIPDAVFFKNREGHFIRVNNAWASRREGVTPDDAIGK